MSAETPDYEGDFHAPVEVKMNGAAPLLGRDAFLQAISGIEYREVDLPGGRGRVRVKALTASERDKFEASMWVGKGTKKEISLLDLRAKLVALTLVDGNGARLFRDNEYPRLGEGNAAVIDFLADVARDLSGMTEADEEELLGKPETPFGDSIDA